ncbi:MAG: hypothetical protein IT364_24955 [Candidatus Hydrogenedentes bacterium]|nr:hypothetical protein [Candidatus Hydrogenedentota bacterium]
MRATSNQTGPSGDANPYNIDYSRERRLKNIFIGLIAMFFVIAAILVFGAFFLDFTNPMREPVEPPVLRSPESTPAKTHRSGAPTLIAQLGSAVSGIEFAVGQA